MYLEIVYIILGILLLTLGRKLFWLFVGSIAFIVVLEYARLLLPEKPEGTILIIALVFVIIGLILAFVAQKVGLGIAGFMAGGYIALHIVQELGINVSWVPWVVFLIGAFAGVVLVTVLFNWALIILSSLTGAFLIIRVTDFSLYLTKILFIVLIIIGIATQANQLQKST